MQDLAIMLWAFEFDPEKQAKPRLKRSSPG